MLRDLTEAMGELVSALGVLRDEEVKSRLDDSEEKPFYAAMMQDHGDYKQVRISESVYSQN